MRILHLLNHSRHGNGNVHQVVDLACAQAAEGDEVAVCSGGGDYSALLQHNGVENIGLCFERAPGSLVRAAIQLRRLIAERRPDVVHAHMMTVAVLGWLACLGTSSVLVTTVHNSFQKSAVLMGLGRRLIAVSEAVRKDLARRGIPKSRLRVVLNGTIGSARFGDGPCPADLSHPSLTYVGGLHERKAIDTLLMAFAQIVEQAPEATLHIVGEGPLASHYAQLAKDLGCAERVRFMGYMADPRPILAATDIFLLASRRDPAPLVLSEAREAGCAIVATAVDGVPEMLANGRAGVLVEPDAPAQIAEAVLELLRDPSALANARQRSAIDLADLSIRRVVAQTRAVYEDALAAARQ